MPNIKFFALFLVLATMMACQPQSIESTSENSMDSHKVSTYDLPFAVGSSTRFIHDDSRPFDSVAGVNTGIRTLLTEIWYPVDHAEVTNGNFKYATYGDYVFGDQEVHKIMMTETTFFHLTPEYTKPGTTQVQLDDAIKTLFDRPRGSYLNAPIAHSEQPLPVIVMTHGDAGSRYNMETVSEYLAAHGYIVIAPEHTGNSPYSLTGRDPAFKDPAFSEKMSEVSALLNANGTYGSHDKFGQTYSPLITDQDDSLAMINLDNSLLQRVNDLRATLSELDEMNQQGFFAGRLALDNIGLIGRSFGGTTTLAGLALEPRFTAGVSIVPLLLPDVRATLPKTMLKEPQQESVILNREGSSTLATLTKPTLLLSGAEDSLIIGAGKAMAMTVGSEAPSVDNPLPSLRAAYEQSSAPVFWGLLKNSNHASFGVSGTYWFPELKTESQNRFFMPEETFTLVKTSTAHDIQKNKVLHFFDLMIRGDESAKTKLISKQFTQQGLVFESRNF